MPSRSVALLVDWSEHLLWCCSIIFSSSVLYRQGPNVDITVCLFLGRDLKSISFVDSSKFEKKIDDDGEMKNPLHIRGEFHLNISVVLPPLSSSALRRCFVYLCGYKSESSHMQSFFWAYATRNTSASISCGKLWWTQWQALGNDFWCMLRHCLWWIVWSERFRLM